MGILLQVQLLYCCVHILRIALAPAARVGCTQQQYQVLTVMYFIFFCVLRVVLSSPRCTYDTYMWYQYTFLLLLLLYCCVQIHRSPAVALVGYARLCIGVPGTVNTVPYLVAVCFYYVLLSHV